MPTILTTLDLLYLVSALAIFAVAIFLSWALCELARFFHQANRVVKQARDSIGYVENILQSLTRGLFAEGGKALMGYLQKRKKKES
jgi:hypothetical protein